MCQIASTVVRCLLYLVLSCCSFSYLFVIDFCDVMLFYVYVLVCFELCWYVLNCFDIFWIFFGFLDHLTYFELFICPSTRRAACNIQKVILRWGPIAATCEQARERFLASIQSYRDLSWAGLFSNVLEVKGWQLCAISGQMSSQLAKSRAWSDQQQSWKTLVRWNASVKLDSKSMQTTWWDGCG